MRQFIYKTGLVAVLTVVCGVHNGYAGFEFTAPIQTAPAQQQSIPPLNGALLPQLPNIEVDQGETAMPAMPNQPVESVPVSLAPQQAPINQNNAPRAPMGQPTQQPQTGLSSLAPSNATPMPMSTRPFNEMSYDMAVGFGNDLPLVTALRQVVPDTYAYVLNENVPMGQNVSWEGGRPWNIVLDDMIRPLGLRSNIDGNRVVIENAAVAAPAPSMPRPTTQTAMAPTNIQPVQQPAVMNDAAPEPMVSAPMMVEPMPTPPPAPAPAPVVNMSVNAPQSVAQFSAPTTPPASRVVPQVTHGTWTADRGDSLRSVLEEWAGQAGAELFWSSDFDYPLAGAVNISGTFEEATENLLQGFEQARPKPIARLHPNLPHGPAVLVVETRQTLD